MVRPVLLSLLLVFSLSFVSCRKQLAQTNEDGLRGTFDGKLLKSSFPGAKEGMRCEGTFARERGAAEASVTLKCGDKVVYSGKGAVKLDVRDPKKREDDHLEIEDSKTSKADGTPALKLVGDNGLPDGSSGRLTVWDEEHQGKPAFELIMRL